MKKAIKKPESGGAIFLAALMDAKGALLAAGTPDAAEAAVRLMALETRSSSSLILEASVLQRVKALARKKQAGTEIHFEDFDDLLMAAGRLL